MNKKAEKWRTIIISWLTIPLSIAAFLVTVLNLSGVWNWFVEFRYSAIVFDQRGTIDFSYIYFNSTEMNLATTFT